MKVSGNTILITGAGTGMGLAAAKLFSARGNKVIMVARNEERLKEEAAKLDGADPFACDISDADHVAKLIGHVKDEHPDLNWVFLNAGVTHTYALFEGDDMYANAEQEVHINYLSAVRLTQAFVPLLEPKPNPAIIITTSGVIYAPDVTNATYSATKAALHSFIQSARYVLGKKGSKIKWVELIAPLVDSPFSAGVNSDQKMPPAEVIEDLIKGLEANSDDVRPGLSQTIYDAWRDSPAKAVDMVNAAIGV